MDRLAALLMVFLSVVLSTLPIGCFYLMGFVCNMEEHWTKTPNFVAALVGLFVSFGFAVASWVFTAIAVKEAFSAN